MSSCQKQQIPSLSEDQMWLIAEEYSSAIGETLKKAFKQISSKCYEVTLSLTNKKSIGFGRNQKDAAMNALRKLMEHIATTEAGTKILSDTISLVSDQEMKTEVKVIDLSKFNQKNKSLFNTNVPNKTKISLVPYEVPQKSISLTKNCNERYSIDTLNQRPPKPHQTSNQTDDSLLKQLHEARACIFRLQKQMSELKQQNKKLRGENRNCSSSQKGAKRHSRERVLSEINLNEVDSNDNKKKIPKLNFECLPGFHGNEKSRKSLNQSMMLMLKKK